MKKYGRPNERAAKGLGWVRVEMAASGPVCHMVTTTHRRLVVRAIPLETATALMARGVPSVVRHPSYSRPISART